MTFSALYVLPALAILILFQGSWKPVRARNMYRSKKHKRQAHHKVLFFRVLVVALILATAITRVMPLPHLLEIVQGVVITVAIMTPFCVYIVVNKLWPQPPSDRDETEITGSAPVDAPDLRPAPAHQLAEPGNTSRRHVKTQHSKTPTVQQPEGPSERRVASLEASLEEILQEPFVAGQADSAKERPASPGTENNTATSLHSQSSERESALDQTLSVSEQMETLDDLVDFHDIGDNEHPIHAADPYDPDAPLAYNPLEKAIAVAREAILDEPGIHDYSTENLPAKSRIELSEMVVRLRNDKMKLQKLVIAQKAVIDSEKQAHERTRVVVKDAISVMRHARHGQRIAEKIARRERAERQRLEKDYVKVRRALDNALSTLKTKAERTDVEKA